MSCNTCKDILSPIFFWRIRFVFVMLTCISCRKKIMVQEIYRVCALVLPIALEGLPVSSSGHVSLCAAMIACMSSVAVDGAVPKVLDHLVHLPIALVVAIFFLPRWWYLIAHITRLWRQFFKILYLGFITVLMTALIYFLFQYVGTAWFPLWLGYAITAALLFSLRYLPNKVSGSWTIPIAFILGIAQGLALLPGISRLGITYVTACWLGMRPQKAFELSFLIEWPISIAGFLKGMVALHVSGQYLMLTHYEIFALACASILAFVGLWFMQYLVTNNRVWVVSGYVACLAVIAFVLGI